ncbi:protein kinase domain-containing protein [Streptomyces antimycoticus]
MIPAGDGAPGVSPLHSGDPRAIAGYRFAGRLGQGGQGVVYLGYGSGGEKVAVKLLHASFGADPRARARFAREVESARRVASYSTAQVLTADIEGTQPYVVSEFIEGPSLLEYVRAHGPQRGAALARLAIGTLAALVAVHRAGIVHRDFKPANVLLPPEGPRVVDFGIARVLEATSTLTSQVIGTPAYMAPEQLNGEPVTPATDMFAWGVTMAYAATGRAPFGADSVAAVISAVLNAEPDLAGVDGPLRPVIAACLSKNPAGRPGTRELLARFLDGTPEDGAPAPVPVAAAAPEATLLDAASRAVADLAAAPTTTAVPTPSAPPASVPPRPTSPPPLSSPTAPAASPSRRRLLIGGATLAAGALGGSLTYLLRDRGTSGQSGGSGRTTWTHALRGESVEQITATADTLLLGPPSGPLQALETATGKTRWTHRGQVAHLTRSATAVFVIGDDRLKALDAHGGRTLWSVPVGHPVIGSEGMGLAVAGDAVVTAVAQYTADASSHAVVAARGAADGKQRWSTALPTLLAQGTVSTLTLAASAKVVLVTAYATSGQAPSASAPHGSVFALAADTGKELWRTRLNVASAFGGHAVAGDTVVVGWADVNAYFYAFDAATGKQRWRAPLVEDGTRSLGVGADTVYFCGAHRAEPGGSNTDQAVYALELATGKQRWRAHEQVYGEAWGPVGGGLVLVTDASHGGVWALDSRTGKTVWSIADMPKPTVLAANSTTAFLVAGGDDNGKNQTVHALRIAD